MMRQRLLGWRSGLRVSEIALGCGLLGAGEEGPDPGAAHDILHRFAEHGGTLLDTSSAHQGGRSEELIGQFLAQAGRDRFVVATKYGRPPAGDARSYAGGAHPRAMLAQVEASLRRLNTDRIDLYSIEFPDGVTPIEEILRGADILVRQGKIVSFALSNFPAWQVAHAATLAEARGWTPVAGCHYQYNLLERVAEREHLSACKAFGIGLLAWSSQARGKLVREALDGVPEALAATLRRIASDRDSVVGAVALAWLIAKGAIPVVGARSAAQLAPALAATALELAPSEIAALDEASVAPSAFPSAIMKQLRDSIGVNDHMARPDTLAGY